MMYTWLLLIHLHRTIIRSLSGPFVIPVLRKVNPSKEIMQSITVVQSESKSPLNRLRLDVYPKFELCMMKDDGLSGSLNGNS